MFADEMNPLEVHHLPSWFPGMSFKRKMAIARAFAEHYLEWAFEHSSQSVVAVTSITHLVRKLNNYVCHPSGRIAPSMVRDALRHVEEKGISPEESWIQALKEGSRSTFLGTSLKLPGEIP